MDDSPELAFTSMPGDPDQVRQEIMAQLDIRGWRFWTGVTFRQPPFLSHQVKTNLDHSSALVTAREYLELAGYHPFGSHRKKKFGKKQPTPQTLLYTRGTTSRWAVFLVPSPKNMRIDVSIDGDPVDDYQHTLMQIEYEVELPAGIGVARPSCDFWVAEVLELEKAIVEEIFDQTETRRQAARATAYCLARNYMTCGFMILIAGMITLGPLFFGSGHPVRLPEIFIVGLPLVIVGPLFLFLIISVHLLLASRLGR